MALPRIRLKLSWRIIVACLLLVCAPVTLAWSMGVYDRIVSRSIEQELQLACDAAAEVIARDGDGALRDRAQLSQLGRHHGVMLRVLDPKGRPLLTTSAAAADDRFQLPSWWRPLGNPFYGPGGPEQLAEFERALGPESLRAEVQAAVKRREAASAVRITPLMHLQIFYRAEPLAGRSETIYLTRVSRRSVRALYDFRYQLLKLTLALLVGAAVMATWLMWGVVRPIRRLQQGVRAAMAGDPAARLELDRGDELGELARDFAMLTEQLRRRQQLTAQVAADFAHDLKSPLSTLVAAAELLDGEGGADAVTRRRLAANMDGAADHIARSIEALLQLARLAEQLPQEPHVGIDLSQLAHTVVAAQREQAEASDKAVSIALAAPEKVLIAGIAERLAQLLDNLISNAQVFAASKIQLTLVQAGDSVTLYLSDDGPGVSQGNRARIFQRFFTSRPAGVVTGSGLGLAIAQTIAEAHGGSVELLTAAEQAGLGKGVVLAGAAFKLTLSSARNNAPSVLA